MDLNSFDEIYYRFLNIPAGDLRISITNACNMKCIYCHNEGQQNERVNFLTVDEIKFIVINAQKYGLMKVRLTGGDPLIHPQIHEICRMFGYFGRWRSKRNLQERITATG